MTLNIYPTPAEAIKALADFFVVTANNAVKNNGECNIVLSGGNSPRQLYSLLASYEYNNKVDWDRLYFFFADERHVPFTDAENNGAMVKEKFFDSLNIAGSQIFYINTALSPQDAAKKYAQRILSHFKQRPVRFDLTLLGLGDNAHTASLFPHTKVLHEEKVMVSEVYVEELQAQRITMTASVINESAVIVFLVFGKSKANAVYEVIEGKKDPDTYPAQLIESEFGTIEWFLDDEAAQKLKK